MFDEIIQPSVGADLSRTPPMMNFNDQIRECHSERSEESRCPARQILRGVYPERSEWAQNDKTDLACKSSLSALDGFPGIQFKNIITRMKEVLVWEFL